MGTVMPLGLDYAGGRPGGEAITGAGYRFVCRYLTDGGTGLPGKLLTAAEYGDLQSCGVCVVANWETTATRMLDGYNAGVADARAADAHIQTVGHPSHRPIYFSADFDATPAQQAEIDDYLRGCASVIGLDRVGVYGSYYTVQRCLDNHTATWVWQTLAWSGGQVEPRAHIVQRIGTVTVGGVDCDVNEARKADYGQHPGDDMGLTADQDSKLTDLWHAITDQMSSLVKDSAWTGTPRDVAQGTQRDAYDTMHLAMELLEKLAAIQTQMGTLTSVVSALAAQVAKIDGTPTTTPTPTTQG